MFHCSSLMIFPYVCPDIRGLTNVTQLEQLNKRYWYVCQDYTEYKYPHQPKRFPEIMMCLPEIRCIAGEFARQAQFFLSFVKLFSGKKLRCSPLVFQGSWSTSLWSSSRCCLRQYCTPVSQVWATTGQAPPPAWQRAPPQPTSPASLEKHPPHLLHGGGVLYLGAGLPVPSSSSSHECDKNLFYAFCLD